MGAAGQNQPPPLPGRPPPTPFALPQQVVTRARLQAAAFPPARPAATTFRENQVCFSRYRARIRAASQAEIGLGRTELALAMSQFLQPVMTSDWPLARA